MKMNTFQAVNDIIKDEFRTHPLPFFLEEATGLFQRAHLYYRSFRQVKIHEQAAQNPLQGHATIYGAALHLLSDYSSIGGLAIQIALVTKCTEDLLKEYRCLNENYQMLCDALTVQYPVYQSLNWTEQTPPFGCVVSSSFYLRWKIKMIRFTSRLQRIIQCLGLVFWQCFKTGMVLCDAQLLLTHDSQARFEGCTELVAYWQDYQQQLEDDRDLLLEEIEKGSELFDRILNKLGISMVDSTSALSQLKQEFQELEEPIQEIWDDMSYIAEETLDSIYIPDKITPFHIDLSIGKAQDPALPDGIYPPWGGECIEIEAKEDLTMDKPPLTQNQLFSLSMKSLKWIKQQFSDLT